MESAWATDAIANVRRQWRVENLERLKAGVRYAFEEGLTGTQEHRDEVENDLVDHACCECLTHGGGAAGDVDATLARSLRRAGERGVEALGDEVERRPARHLDRL